MISLLKTFLLAMTPVGELRVSLPIALSIYSLDWRLALFVSIIGNMVPVIFLLLLLGPVSQWLSNNSLTFKRFFDWLFERTRKKTSLRMERYGDIALISFVAVPLPLTGAWTGAIAAFLFGVPFKRAFALILSGVIIAGVIVLLLIETGLLWLT